jgi:hypothetical protein
VSVFSTVINRDERDDDLLPSTATEGEHFAGQSMPTRYTAVTNFILELFLPSSEARHRIVGYFSFRSIDSESRSAEPDLHGKAIPSRRRRPSASRRHPVIYKLCAVAGIIPAVVLTYVVENTGLHGHTSLIDNSKGFEVLNGRKMTINTEPEPLPEIRNPLVLRPILGNAQSAAVDPVICVGVQRDGTTITVPVGSVQLSVRGAASRLEVRSGNRADARIMESLRLHAGDRVHVTRNGSRVLLELTSNSEFRADDQVDRGGCRLTGQRVRASQQLMLPSPVRPGSVQTIP